MWDSAVRQKQRLSKAELDMFQASLEQMQQQQQQQQKAQPSTRAVSIEEESIELTASMAKGKKSETLGKSSLLCRGTQGPGTLCMTPGAGHCLPTAAVLRISILPVALVRLHLIYLASKQHGALWKTMLVARQQCSGVTKYCRLKRIAPFPNPATKGSLQGGAGRGYDMPMQPLPSLPHCWDWSLPLSEPAVLLPAAGESSHQAGPAGGIRKMPVQTSGTAEEAQVNAKSQLSVCLFCPTKRS